MRQELNALCLSIIEKRVADKSIIRNDMVQSLIDASELATICHLAPGVDKPLSKDEVVAQSVVMFGAGSETTSTALAFIAYHLALDQPVQEKLNDEIIKAFPDVTQEPDYDSLHSLSYLDMVIKEGIRLYPNYVVNRFCMDDTTICGAPCRKHFGVVEINMYAMHFNQTYFGPVNVNEFYPERFSPEYATNRPENAFMAFGIGPRQCVGMRVAMMEMKTALVEIIRRFRIIEPDGGAPIPLPVKVDLVTIPADGIHVKIIKR